MRVVFGIMAALLNTAVWAQAKADTIVTNGKIRTARGTKFSELLPHTAAGAIHFFRGEASVLLFSRGDRGQTGRAAVLRAAVIQAETLTPSRVAAARISNLLLDMAEGETKAVRRT